jgi:hypothetical protein
MAGIPGEAYRVGAIGDMFEEQGRGRLISGLTNRIRSPALRRGAPDLRNQAYVVTPILAE